MLSFLAGLAVVSCLRRPRRLTCSLMVFGGLFLHSVAAPSALALDFDTRMVVLDPDNPGSNDQVNNALEARGILRGTVTDVNILEDVSGTVDFLDFAGGAGAFGTDNPYPNGVNDENLNDFIVQVTAFLEIPEGDWNIGFNSDDGGILTMPRVNFLTTTNENGATGVPGEIIYNGTRGQGTFTAGSFTVPSGETLRTEFEMIMFERAGGDALEVGILDGVVESNGDWAAFAFELSDGEAGWKLLDAGPAPGDFNWDDEVNFDDFVVMANNFVTGSTFAQGDLTGDARVDLADFVQFIPLLTPPAGAAAVPEPTSLGLLSVASVGLLLSARRRRTRSS